MSIKRYDAIGAMGYPSDECIIEDPKGRYVIYSDIAALESERDTLAARLAAAEGALRKAESWTDRIHSALSDSTRPKQAVGEMVCGLLDFLRADMADHSPATPQYTPLEPEPWGGPDE